MSVLSVVWSADSSAFFVWRVSCCSIVDGTAARSMVVYLSVPLDTLHPSFIIAVTGATVTCALLGHAPPPPSLFPPEPVHSSCRRNDWIMRLHVCFVLSASLPAIHRESKFSPSGSSSQDSVTATIYFEVCILH